MTMDSIRYASATELAEEIRKGSISPSEATQEVAKLAQTIGDDALEAVAYSREKQALYEAKEVEKSGLQGQLAGVPVSVKETFGIQGEKQSANALPFIFNRAKDTSKSIDRLRKMGAIVVVRSLSSELAMAYQGHGTAHWKLSGKWPFFQPKRTKNPFDVSRTTGASSAGEAALIAAGISPLGLGSDGGGSIRIPSHYSGIIGLKPTVGTMPIDEEQAHMPAVPGARQKNLVIGSAGPMAREVRDIKLGFEVMRDNEGTDWKEANVERKLSDYRVSVVNGFGEFSVGSATLKEFEVLRQQLGLKGARIGSKSLNLTDEDYLEAWKAWGHIFGHFAAQGFPDNFIGKFLRRGQQKKFRKTYGDNFLVNGLIEGLNNDSVQHQEAHKTREETIAKINEFFKTHDFLITPVTMGPAFEHCKDGEPLIIDGKKVDFATAIALYTTLFNLSGHPALSLPLTQVEENGVHLPIGIQIVGKYHSENDLFHFAEMLIAQGVVSGFQKPSSL